MKELTNAEEQIMQAIWAVGAGFLKDIVEALPEPRPAYSTVATVIRILEQKNFVAHRTYGKTHEYYPLVTKQEYTKGYFQNFLKKYFSGSFSGMLSFFADEQDVDLHELEQLLKARKKKDKPEDNQLTEE
jgi:predicted transcriptional regulator